MGDVHQLVLTHGAAQAKLLAPERAAEIDIAAEIMGAEGDEAGFSYTGFALTALPYRPLPPDQSWYKEGFKVALSLDPGSLRVRGRMRKFGVPFGNARLVLIYLQSEAVRTQSPEIAVGSSLSAFATDKLGLKWGGNTGKNLEEQLFRLAACTMRFHWESASHEGFESKGFIKSAAFAKEGDARQARLWDDTVTLDDAFFQHLTKHSVPLLDAAVRSLHDEPVALDTYIWLSYRLRHLTGPTGVSWAALKEQFGAGYKLLRQFRPKYAASLRKALAAYPEAKVEIDEKGIVLHPSRPPVAPRSASRRIA